MAPNVQNLLECSTVTCLLDPKLNLSVTLGMLFSPTFNSIITSFIPADIKMLGGVDLKTLRAIRVLRPLKLVSGVPSKYPHLSLHLCPSLQLLSHRECHISIACCLYPSLLAHLHLNALYESLPIGPEPGRRDSDHGKVGQAWLKCNARLMVLFCAAAGAAMGMIDAVSGTANYHYHDQTAAVLPQHLSACTASRLPLSFIVTSCLLSSFSFAWFALTKAIISIPWWFVH